MVTQIGGMAEYSAADTAAQWYFSKEDMRNTPSVAGSDYSTPSGKSYTPAEESSWRQRGCNFVHNVVKKLDINSAWVGEVAGACVLLASKVEENKRGHKDIAHACSYVASKGQAKEAAGNREKWERALKRQEIVVLENCCFDMDIAHPYGFIDALALEFGIPVFIAKAATALVNDTMRTPICLLYRPEVAAVAALYFALEVHRHALARSLLESRHVRLSPVAPRLVEECMLDMLDFYRREADSELEAHRQQQQHKGAPRSNPPHYT
ncbi:hypothetical protein GGI04_001881 [Coemansia thaxteri]|nr:hypothetical protein GGI04_001881 [Coemansia thaxteri]